MVTGERCLEHLLEVNFPGFRREAGEWFAYETLGSNRAKSEDWELAARIVNPVNWRPGS